jgi:hypothetical protein
MSVGKEKIKQCGLLVTPDFVSESEQNQETRQRFELSFYVKNLLQAWSKIMWIFFSIPTNILLSFI